MSDGAVAEGRTPTEYLEDWPLRPWLLAGLLAVAGLLVWLFSDGGDTLPWRMAAAAFVFFAGIAAAFTLERHRWKEPFVFALVAGLVMAGLAWRAVAAGDRYADEEYGFAAGLIATALALPLFQAGFHRARFSTPYERVHYHVWNDAISAGGAVAFTGASWLLLLILSELFKLLEIRLLADLMEEGWFGMPFTGAAFGAALGTLRNQLKVLGTLQSVVMLVLSILAVPLAAGLIVFLFAMVVSGPEVLWRATRSATPVLLLCAAGAWVLANAILRDSDAEMSDNRLLRWAALALALAILPLTVFAAVSMGTRIDQHGLSPERLWGLVAIAVAVTYGLAWLAAVVRGLKPGTWRERPRRANLHLAVLISGIALLLALPIFDFGAVSARNQVARLEAGKVSPEEFDYSALRWDFGDAGRRALVRLEKSENERVAELAKAAQEQDQDIDRFHDTKTQASRRENMRVQSADPAWEERIREHFAELNWHCNQPCFAVDLGFNASGKRRIKLIEGAQVTDWNLNGGTPPDGFEVTAPEQRRTAGPLKKDSKVEVRKWEGRQIYVDGQPMGGPFP